MGDYTATGKWIIGLGSCFSPSLVLLYLLPEIFTISQSLDLLYQLLAPFVEIYVDASGEWMLKTSFLNT